MAASRLKIILATEVLVLLTQAACVAPITPAIHAAQAARAAGAIAGQASAYVLPAIKRRTENPALQQEEVQSPPLQEEEQGGQPPDNPGNYSQRNQFAEMILANALKAEWRYNAIIDRSGLFYSTMNEFLAYNPEGLPLALELKVEGREEAYVLFSVQLGPAGAMPPRIVLFYGVGQSDGRGNLHNVKQSCSYSWRGSPASLTAFKALTDLFGNSDVARKSGIEAIITEPGTPLSSWCAKEPREAPRRDYGVPGRRF